MSFDVLLFADEKASLEGSTIRLYGVSMLERHLRVFASLGAGSVTVVCPSGDTPEALREHPDRFDARWLASLSAVVYAKTDDLGNHNFSAPCLLADAHHLYDPRLVEAVIAAGPNTALADPQIGLSRRLALLDAGTLKRLVSSEMSASTLWEQLEEMSPVLLRRLNIQTINPYIVNLRRTLPPFWLPVRSAADAHAGEARLIDAAQKGALDWPAQYVHPPFENRLVRLISRTAVTPNQVTVLTNVVAFFATGLLASGLLIAGFVAAALVGVLDGVDGKLARVTVRCSRVGGQVEHILDIVYELSWYWVLGWVLSQSGDNGTWSLALSGGVTVLYFAGRAATGLFKLRRKVELFDYTALDRAFRQISGRRNIYVPMLLVGALFSFPLTAFEMVAAWAGVTALFHWIRAVWLWRQPPENLHAAAYSGEAAS
ncbi:MAG: CDP-alcohol phosphatidyltransferase family protein [candidate division Zixibacteria bacterium]|nr:CDP-alcohol phosphatidyltransferase family protein [candidate division Zixibacteria bacterium]